VPCAQALELPNGVAFVLLFAKIEMWSSHGAIDQLGMV